MKVICREVNKSTGEIAVYPIDSPVTERLLFCLQIRARANPELRYFVVPLSRWENFESRSDIEWLLNKRNVPQKMIDGLPAIVEL